MMKHKFAYLCILTLLVGVLVLAGVVVSQSASAPKATGGVKWASMENGMEIENWAEFEAIGGTNGQPAKGWVKYHNSNGMSFRVDVQCLTVVDDWAFFSGPVVSADDTLMLNQWLKVVVYDGGSPGSKGDKIWGEFYSADPGCQPFYPTDMANVENGNLMVH
jgi:hypothetical protein